MWWYVVSAIVITAVVCVVRRKRAIKILEKVYGKGFTKQDIHDYLYDPFIRKSTLWTVEWDRKVALEKSLETDEDRANKAREKAEYQKNEVDKKRKVAAVADEVLKGIPRTELFLAALTGLIPECDGRDQAIKEAARFAGIIPEEEG